MTAQQVLKKIMDLGLLSLDGDFVVGVNGNKSDDNDVYQALMWAPGNEAGIDWKPIDMDQVVPLKDYLVCGKGQECAVAYYDPEDQQWVTDYDGRGYPQWVIWVSHFAELNPPKVVKG